MSNVPDALIDAARKVIEVNRAAGLKVAVAESCTGGLVSAALTEIPGASDVFDAGFVTYGNNVKHSVLGVSEDVLDTFGAVSIAVAWAMAQGAMERSGADVAVAYLNEHEDAAETKRAVEGEGRRCITMAGDVADAAFCEAAVRKTIEAFGRLDILVNNAAFQEHVQDFVDLTEEHFDRTLKTNLYGYFHMAKAAVPHMKSSSQR